MKLEYNKQDIQQALNTITNSMSQRKAELEYKVSRATLQNRIKGHISRQKAHVPQQRLSTVQEQRFAKWVLVQESLGLAPTHGHIRAFASRILLARGDAAPLGKRWIAGFLRRNPILKTKKQFRIDSARVNSVTTEVIKKWWPRLLPLAVKAIKGENRYNINETGIIKGMRDNSLVVRSANKRFIQKKHPRSKA
jgi:4-hydroxybenzoate polyprenyltransferase